VCGHVWACVGMFGHVRACLGVCGHVWACVGMCGRVWACVGVGGSALASVGMRSHVLFVLLCLLVYSFIDFLKLFHIFGHCIKYYKRLAH
jgi:hypothetical protein